MVSLSQSLAVCIARVSLHQLTERVREVLSYVTSLPGLGMHIYAILYGGLFLLCIFCKNTNFPVV